jgi:hypothetical protein
VLDFHSTIGQWLTWQRSIGHGRHEQKREDRKTNE